LSALLPGPEFCNLNKTRIVCAWSTVQTRLKAASEGNTRPEGVFTDRSTLPSERNSLNLANPTVSEYYKEEFGGRALHYTPPISVFRYFTK
jgi:hypothetical protein